MIIIVVMSISHLKTLEFSYFNSSLSNILLIHGYMLMLPTSCSTQYILITMNHSSEKYLIIHEVSSSALCNMHLSNNLDGVFGLRDKIEASLCFHIIFPELVLLEQKRLLSYFIFHQFCSRIFHVLLHNEKQQNLFSFFIVYRISLFFSALCQTSLIIRNLFTFLFYKQNLSVLVFG